MTRYFFNRNDKLLKTERATASRAFQTIINSDKCGEFPTTRFLHSSTFFNLPFLLSRTSNNFSTTALRISRLLISYVYTLYALIDFVSSFINVTYVIQPTSFIKLANIISFVAFLNSNPNVSGWKVFRVRFPGNWNEPRSTFAEV